MFCEWTFEWDGSSKVATWMAATSPTQTMGTNWPIISTVLGRSLKSTTQGEWAGYNVSANIGYLGDSFTGQKTQPTVSKYWSTSDKPTRCESMPKIAPIRRAYNVVADDTGLSSFV